MKTATSTQYQLSTTWVLYIGKRASTTRPSNA